MKRIPKIKGILAVIMAIAMVVTLFPISAFAYVGAMSKNAGVVTAGTQDGYFYLQNSYMGFYIRPDGSMTTVPSQKNLNDVKTMGATETHAFYRQLITNDEMNPVKTEEDHQLYPSGSSVRIESGTENPKLVQTFEFSDGTGIDITYELVRLDQGASTGTTGMITEYDGSDSGKTWGVFSEAKISNAPNETSIRWRTWHSRFGGVGRSVMGNLRLGRSIYASGSYTHYSSPLYSTTNYMETISGAYRITEVFTDSFSYANQFVALAGYMDAGGFAADGQGGWIFTLWNGVRGHENNYGHEVQYSAQNNSTVRVGHDFPRNSDRTGEGSTFALWGFRDLYESGAANIPADPASIPADAGCLGIVKNGSSLSAQPAQNENELEARYGDNLAAVFRGSFKQDSGNFVFQNGAAQLSPSLTATWEAGSGGLTVAPDGTVTAKNVHLSVPSFKFYKPKYNTDSSLVFSYGGDKLSIDITPANNSAILHIDIPGAKCVAESVTADLDGGLVFTGEMEISTPFIDAASIQMNRLGMGIKNNTFGITGVEASGSIDMEKLMGLDVGSASGEINTFPGEERYAFELELNVFDMFEAEGELELTRIKTGALIPNTLKLKAASEVGVPLVPPVVVAEFNGLSGGFSNLAQTINGDLFATPPLRLTVGAKGTVLEAIEGWYEITIGAGYYETKLSDGTILDLPVIDEYGWYMELAGERRFHNYVNYTGLSVKGGMKLDLAITKDMPFIKAGSTINASAFAGIGNAADGKRIYAVLGADGKLYGLVQIPSEAWAFGDLELLHREVDFALGGETDFLIGNRSVSEAAKEAFRNISAYGGVAYTGKIVGLPFRIYYIFQDKDVGINVGMWWDSFDPFDPSPYNRALLNEKTGEQIGVLVANDNIVMLASSAGDGEPGMLTEESGSTTPSGIAVSGSAIAGVTITQTDTAEKSYEVALAENAPDPEYLAFSLILKEGSGATSQELLEDLNITTADGAALSLTPAEFDGAGVITNPDTANTVMGEDYVTFKLPNKGTWNIASGQEPFDIVCYYASPYAALTGMSISGGVLSGTVQDMDSGTSYILRTYLGTEKGSTDYLIAQSEVPADGAISDSISLSGGAVPTGDYYVTTVLLEQIKEDFDGDGIIENEEIAFIKTDAHEFDDVQKVSYTNDIQPNTPGDVTLTSIGSELMRGSWKEPSAGPDIDGYYIRLYQEDGSDWVATGANYLLKADDLEKSADGDYLFDMAVTVGNDNADKGVSPLETNKSYKIGITAFHYLADEDGDGKNDSIPVESPEMRSDGKYLPKASFPKLTCTPEPVTAGEHGMKLLNIRGKTSITVTSDVNATILVTRMDMDEGAAGAVVKQTENMDTTLIFDTPDYFDGALNLKIAATDAEGDVTVDYLGLRLDDVPPLLALDSDSFNADYNTGSFSVTGVTESNAKVKLEEFIAGDETNGGEFNDLDENWQVTANEKGEFTLEGKFAAADELRPAADSATIMLQARDAAGNASTTAFAQIIRTENGSTPETPVITAAPPSMDFGGVPVGSTSSDDLAIGGSNLTGNITYTVSGDSAAFSLDASGWNAASGGTLQVTFTPTQEKSYAASVEFTSPGASPVTVMLSGSSYTSGGNDTVDSLSIKTAPAKTSYTEGEALELTGLVVILHKSNSTTEDVALADFSSNGITVSPTNGTVLAVSNTKVTITHTASGKTAEQTIVVNAAPVIDAAVSPANVNYDLATPADVSTNITWNSATTVTSVVYSGTPLASSTDYVVSGSALTIKDSYLAAQSFTAGNTADFIISFNKGNSATLTVSIVNNHTPGSNADLSDLMVDGSPVNSFTPATISYDVVLPYGTLSGSMTATVGATAADTKAGVIVTQAATLPGSATVEVTAEDGTTKKTYTINFTLGAAPHSSEKDVTGVNLPSGAVISGTSITKTVANSITSQVIDLSVSEKASWRFYSDAGCTNEIIDKIMTLSEGTNTAYVVVTAEDGTTKAYTLTITREGSVPSVIQVTGISITGGNVITAKNGVLQLTADVTPANATNKAVIWSIASGNSYAALNSTGLLTAQGNGTVTVRATAQDGSGVYGEWQIAISGQDSGGGGSSTSEPSKPAILTEKQPDMPTTAKMSVSGTVQDRVLSASITEQMVKDAIKAAQDAAKKSGKEVDGIAVEFTVTGSGSYVNLNAALDAGAIDRLKEAGVKFIKIGSAVLDITLDTDAIAEIDKQSTGTVAVSARVRTKLSTAAKKLIGSRPVFDITVGYQKNGETENVTNFGKGTLTLGIAYNAAANESTGNLFGVYVAKNGKPQMLDNSSYDNGRLIFSRNSLSTYGVGYTAPALSFTDTSKHWAKDNIDYVASRGLISGISAKIFDPDTAITRADFLMALGRLSGADVSGYKISSFSDVKVTDPAMPYIEWAVKNQIVQGIGNNKFGPDQQISRQDMAVMMQNYAKATGYKLPVSNAAVTFSDSAKVNSYAKEAVTAIQQAGIMLGKGSNTFDPTGNATRGEASTILRRFVELVIDEGTARGWNQNDAGQWLYIDENGKFVIGWLTEENDRYYFISDGLMVSGKWLQIEGKWYYFYADGSLAINVKIDGYEVDENGVRKTK